jgi:ATP-dependent protease HslVU (ClpYQ) peptidase subunit
MSIVCAKKTEDGVWIASDKRLCDKGFIFSDHAEKWVKMSSGLWIGYVGHSAILAALGSVSTLTTDELKTRGLASRIREWAREDGWDATSTDGAPPDFSYDLIVVDPSKGRVFLLCGDGSATDVGEEFVAIGSGREFAYGAAYAAGVAWTGDDDPTYMAKDIVTNAVRAAMRYDNECGGDTWVRHV